MKEKYLPIGSVVLLKGATKRVMVSGFLAVDNEDTSVVYDYSGCMYPEGFLGSDQVLMFNHDQIESISFAGFEDKEQEEFLKNLKEIANGLMEQRNVETLESNQ